MSALYTEEKTLSFSEARGTKIMVLWEHGGYDTT